MKKEDNHLLFFLEQYSSMKLENNKIKGEMYNPSMGTVLMQIELRCLAKELSGSKKHG